MHRQHQFTGLNWLLRRSALVLGTFFPQFRLICNSATFGLSSLGALGVEMILGPSICTSIFALGAVEPRPVVRAGKIEIRPMVTISLKYDNNIMDTEQAPDFFQMFVIYWKRGWMRTNRLRTRLRTKPFQRLRRTVIRK
ncbi:MAG: 2-oxo acid dehydrogenase subunit E2 [Candidatus Obscuribacterales bacterium]|nr:2-oxo acid dehydrogenase subunit E2 [Candidatus Obscuribacterales bacterium]